MKFSFLLIILVSLTVVAGAQGINMRTVEGNVRGADNRTLQNCAVNIFQERKGTVTDKDGRFSISIPKNRTVYLSVVNRDEPAYLIKVSPNYITLNIKLDKATREASTAYLTEYNRNVSLRDQAFIRIDEPVPTKDVDPNSIYNAVDNVPKFKGGDKALSEYLAANLKYSERDKENDVQGKVIITMVVERDGSLTDIQVVRGISTDCDKEAVRLMKTSPKWIPGMMSGKPVRCRYSVPIKFPSAN